MVSKSPRPGVVPLPNDHSWLKNWMALQVIMYPPIIEFMTNSWSIRNKLFTTPTVWPVLWDFFCFFGCKKTEGDTVDGRKPKQPPGMYQTL